MDAVINDICRNCNNFPYCEHIGDLIEAHNYLSKKKAQYKPLEVVNIYVKCKFLKKI